MANDALFPKKRRRMVFTMPNTKPNLIPNRTCPANTNTIVNLDPSRRYNQWQKLSGERCF